MADDPNQARAALEAEAARLAAKRIADEQAESAKAAMYAEREQQKHLPDLGSLRAAHSRGMLMGLAATLFCGGIVAGFISAMPEKEDSDEPGDLTTNEVIFASVFVLAGFAVASHRVTAIRRSRRWRASLPFKIHDYERILGIGLFISKAIVTVTFRDAAPTSEVLSELVLAKLPASVVSNYGPTANQIRTPDFGAEAANWPLANWLRKLVDKVLIDVHAAYAIESITLAALTTTEFYIPSGD